MNKNKSKKIASSSESDNSLGVPSISPRDNKESPSPINIMNDSHDSHVSTTRNRSMKTSLVYDKSEDTSDDTGSSEDLTGPSSLSNRKITLKDIRESSEVSVDEQANNDYYNIADSVQERIVDNHTQYEDTALKARLILKS